MKIIKYCITGILLLTTTALLAQDCVDYFKSSGCNIDRQRGYDLYSQSKSVAVSVKDTVEFNIVFYGQKEYVFTFCTRQDLYPVHFLLIDPDTRNVLYDNASDRFIETLEVGFDTSRPLCVRINVLEDRLFPDELQEVTGCIGLLIQYRNYPK